MIDQLVTAGLGGLVFGAFMLGAFGVQLRRNTRAIDAVHARFDALVIALAEKNVVSAGAIAHLARVRPRAVKP